jgi:lipopolysaccharide assembly protein A
LQAGNQNGIFGCRFFWLEPKLNLRKPLRTLAFTETSRTISVSSATATSCPDGRRQYQQGSRAMKVVFRVLAVLLFIVFFGFALKNTQEAALYFFLGYEVKGPLVLLLLVFFVSGAVLGIFAMLPTVFRHRRELARHRKTISTMQSEQEAQRQARMQPPQPDSVVNK